MPVFWWDTAGFLRHAGTETSAISTTCGHPSLTHGMPFHNSQFYVYVSCMCVCCFPCNCCLAMYHKLLYMHAVTIRNLCYFCQHREHELLIYHIYHGLLVSTTTQLSTISEWKVFWSFWSFHCRLFISVSRYTSFSNFMSDSALLLHIRKKVRAQLWLDSTLIYSFDQFSFTMWWPQSSILHASEWPQAHHRILPLNLLTLFWGM